MNNQSPAQAIQTAFDYQRAGRLQESEELFRQILSQNPGELQALNGLGTIALHTGRTAEAANLFSRAVSINPQELGIQMNLGTALLKLGRLQDAGRVYSQVISVKPDFAEAHTNLGVVLADAGRLEEAAAAHRRAIQLKPQFGMSYQNLGTVLREMGKHQEAVDVLRRGLAIEPGRVELYSRLGIVYTEMGSSDRARYQDAIDTFKRGLALEPNHPYLLTNLGVASARLGHVHEAVALHRRALELYPNFPLALMNLGVALHNLGQFEEAKECYRHAVALDPNDISMHTNLAIVKLVQGDWEGGLRDNEKRLDNPQQYRRTWESPRWDGSDPKGKTIVIAAEQGIGDTINFVRYASLLADRGAKVIVEAQENLVSLLGRVPGVSQVVPQFSQLPPYDAYVPIPSLPFAFGTTPQNVPANIPYITPDPVRAEKWKDRLSQSGPEFKIGLVWGGSPNNRADVYRSVLLAELAPLAQAQGVRFFSLQKGRQASQLLSPPPGMQITDLGAELETFEDTAALVANLDLLISVDTSIVHLAGAMGRPVWTLIAFSPDWRWLLNRSDTPWYPTMRLFRQPSFGDWSTVMQTVAKELNSTVSEHRAK